MIKLKFLVLLILITSCGGGGGGSSPEPIAPPAPAALNFTYDALTTQTDSELKQESIITTQSFISKK